MKLSYRQMYAIHAVIALLLWVAPMITCGEQARQKSGTLTVRFIYNGKPPLPQQISINTQRSDLLGTRTWDDPAAVEYKRIGVADRSLLVNEKGEIKNIVIWLCNKDVPIPSRVKPVESPTMYLRKGLLEPRVLAVQAPQVLVIRNEDAHPTNFRSTGFNVLVQSRGGVEVRVTQHYTGRTLPPGEVKSDFFPWMKAWIFACNHPYFAVTGDDGTFQIDNIPVGDWEFCTWHEQGGSIHTVDWPKGRFKVSIREGENDLGTVALPAAEFGKKARRLRNGFTPLHIAALSGDVERARELLKAGVSVDVPHEVHKGTPLQYAASNGNLDLARLLLDHGALVDSTDLYGRTPLMWAAQTSRVAVVHLLLERDADRDLVCKQGRSALYYARRSENDDIVQLLENGGSVQVDDTDEPLADDVADVHVKESSLIVIRNKTLGEWIDLVTTGQTVDEQHLALQVLRNDGLGVDRTATLRVFTAALSDKTLSVRSLAAAGLKKAGRPTHPNAPAQLARVIQESLVHLRESDDSRIGVTARAITALETIGTVAELPTLRKLSQDKRIDGLLRQLAEKAIRRITEQRGTIVKPAKQGLR